MKFHIAVANNMKIITDTKAVKEEPWYNKEWIRVIESPIFSKEDIMWLEDKNIKPNYPKQDIFYLTGEY